MQLETQHIDKPGETVKRVALVVLALVLLVSGGIVYVLFRSLSLPMFEWLNSYGLMGFVRELRMICEDISPGDFVLYNLPDLLWIMSYLLFVNALIPKADRTRYLFWLLLMPVLAIGQEVMQGVGLTAGSFDIIDILCYFLPTVLNLLIVYSSKLNIKLFSLLRGQL